MIRITRSYEISCAHHLPLHQGKCRTPHGHNYQVEVTVWADELITSGPSTGMVMDFAELDVQAKFILNGIDHQDLNLVLPEDYQPPTAEHLAQYLFNSIPANIWSIKVWETRNSYVEISR